ncbi:MAG: fumarylacetoacetate hydrolase family protein [Actinobacteria bacterium]|nr:fumarylacetoacetate hydrolase family protein [Actinomycetota bacterium]
MGFRLANIDGRAALVDGLDYYDIESTSGGSMSPDPMAALTAKDRLHELAAGLSAKAPTGSTADVRFGAPVPSPRNCYAIGLNYRSHVEESGMDLPDVPLVFTKFPSCIVGPNDEVELRSESADYEAELVVVIGSSGRDIAADAAWDHILGVTVGQDISDRALQFAAKPPHFDLGKSRDTYGPIGPVVVSPDLLDNQNGLPITCDINGERRQDGNTSDLIFDVAAIVAYLSAITTLAAGDIIFTGTPDGVGATQGKFLGPGDVITTTIEGVGTLVNRCR